MAITVYKRTGRLGATSEYLSQIDGADLLDGDLAFVVDSSNVFDVYELDDDSGATESSPQIIAPDTNPGLLRWIQKRQSVSGGVPTGTIVAWLPGFFADSSNGTFTSNHTTEGDINTVTLANSLLNTDGWYVCNGAERNTSGSDYFDSANRYLPNLTDDRMLMGDTTAGSIGGSNSQTHNHSMPHTHEGGSHSLSVNEMPAHDHTSEFVIKGTDLAAGYQCLTSDPSGSAEYVDTDETGSGATHSHGTTVSQSAASTSSNSAMDNRPNFLACFYIIKVV